MMFECAVAPHGHWPEGSALALPMASVRPKGMWFRPLHGPKTPNVVGIPKMHEKATWVLERASSSALRSTAWPVLSGAQLLAIAWSAMGRATRLAAAVVGPKRQVEPAQSLCI